METLIYLQHIWWKKIARHQCNICNMAVCFCEPIKTYIDNTAPKINLIMYLLLFSYFKDHIKGASSV